MLTREPLLVAILIVVSLTIFFFRLGERPLWDIDEGMHATTSKEMILSGDWITATFNGENFYDKPLLYNWLVNLSFLTFGFSEFGARFPGALLGLGTVLLTYLLGRRMFGTDAGFLGAVILATSPQYITLSRAVVHDITLVFFITLALFFFYLGFASERHRKLHFFLFYASTAFAALAKGPVGVVLPALIIGSFLLLRGRLGFLKEMQIAWGAVIFLFIAAPWYILTSLRNSEYAGYFFLQQNLMNFISSDQARHPQPFYYYLPILFGGFSPWSFFLPLGLIRPLQKGLKKMDGGLLFLILWFGLIFLFFSAASSKLGPYILPSFPAAALLVGVLWNDLFYAPTPGLRRGLLYSFLPIVIFLGIACTVLTPPAELETKYGLDVRLINSLAFGMLGAMILALVLFLKRWYRTFFAINVGLMVCILLVFIVLVVPAINPHRSSRALAQKIDVLLSPGERLVFFRAMRDSALFYTNRRATILRNDDALKAHLRSGKAFIMPKEHFVKRRELLESSAQVLADEGRDLVIKGRAGLSVRSND